jgi:hypothetical protein
MTSIAEEAWKRSEDYAEFSVNHLSYPENPEMHNRTGNPLLLNWSFCFLK